MIRPAVDNVLRRGMILKLERVLATGFADQKYSGDTKVSQVKDHFFKLN
jgi:hypothetical protein